MTPTEAPVLVANRSAAAAEQLFARLLRTGAATDVVLLAPSTVELSRSDWLPQAIDTIDRNLRTDGVAYALVPRRVRSRLLRLAASRGLRAGAAFIHLTHGSSEYAVRCDATSLRLLLESLPMSRMKSHLIGNGIHVPHAAQGLWLTAPRCGVVLQRAGAPDPGGWMWSGAPGETSHVALARIKQRPSNGTAVAWLCRPGADRPVAVIKSAVDQQSELRITSELLALDRIGPRAASAGARIPSVEKLTCELATARFPHLDGTPADVALAADPSKRDDIVLRVAEWLQHWHALTGAERVIDGEWIEAEIHAPARALASLVTDARSYITALTWLCARTRGSTVRFVATHGDLTMSNVLVQRSGPLGIVDWEAARETGVPTSDLYYAAADALAASRRYSNRERALIETFEPATAYGSFISGLARRIDPAHASDPALPELFRHATALHHAWNEQKKRRGGRQPFAGLLNHLAARLVARP